MSEQVTQLPSFQHIGKKSIYKAHFIICKQFQVWTWDAEIQKEI